MIGSNSITKEGAKALAEMLKKNATLQALNLEINNIQAEGTEAIAEALTVNTTLEKLNLCMM